MNTIHSASKPFFYSDSIALEYFQCLTSLIGQNTEAFMSPIGIEFINNFILQHHHSSGSGIATGETSKTVTGKIQTSIKKLLHFQKTRDAVISIGQQNVSAPDQTPAKAPQAVDDNAAEKTGKYRSIFYSFILRCVSQLL